MKEVENYISSSDNKTQLRLLEWLPDSEPIGIIQIAHGMTEHIGRYKKFAEYFTDKGYIVVGHDFIGHGLSVSKDFIPMYFGIKGSWNYIVDDIYNVFKLNRNKYCTKYENLKYCILGFSLGSYAVRHLLFKYSKEISNKIDYAVLIGTGNTSFIENKIAELIVNWQIKKYGETAVTDVINKLAFETYNKKFTKDGTGFEWLLKYKPALNEYMNDVLCTKYITTGLFRELIYGMRETGKLSNIRKTNKNVHIYLLCGEYDFVSNFYRGIIKLYNKFKKTKHKRIFCNYILGMRHDILHEKRYIDVFKDIYYWMSCRDKDIY